MLSHLCGGKRPARLTISSFFSASCHNYFMWVNISFYQEVLKLISTLFQALITLCLSLGIKRATQAIIALPALILTPVFSFWTFGPQSSGGYCAYKKIARQNIEPRFTLTWINTLLTLGGSFGVAAIIYKLEKATRQENQLSMDQLNFCDSLHVNHSSCLEITQIFSYSYLLVFGFALIPLLLIQFLDKCSCLCCGCFKEHCLPMTEKYVYDTENPLSHWPCYQKKIINGICIFKSAFIIITFLKYLMHNQCTVRGDVDSTFMLLLI